LYITFLLFLDVLKSRKSEIMSETKKREFHTPEYKAKVALEALRSG